MRESLMNDTILKDKFLSFYSVSLVIILMGSVHLNSLLLLYLLIGGTTLLLFNPIYILPVYIISSLSSDYFVAADGIGISRIVGFVIIIGGIIYQYRKNYPFRKKDLMFFSLIFFYAYLSSFISITHSFYTFISLAQFIIIIVLLGQFRDLNLQNLSRILIISAAVTIIALAFTLQDNLISIQTQRLTTGENVNENRFAMMLAQLNAMIFAGIILFNKKRILQLSLIIILILGYFMLILSGSRSATLGISGSIIIILFYFIKHQKVYRSLIMLFFIVIIGFVFIKQIQQLNIPFINRFSVGSVVESRGSQRLDAIQKLTPITLNNSPLFGYGIGGDNGYALAHLYGIGHPPHNFIIDMLIQTGVIGVFLFFSFFKYIGIRLKNSLNNLNILLPVMILLTGFINGIGETIYLEKFFWNGIALGLLYLNNLKRKDTKI